MMKSTIRAAAPVAIVLGLMLSSVAEAKNHKVTICHKGKEISVSENAVDAHVRNHGDTVGPCEEDVVCPCWTTEQIATAFEIAQAVEDPDWFCDGFAERSGDEFFADATALFTNDSSGNAVFADVDYSEEDGMVEDSSCEVDVDGEAEFGLAPIFVDDLSREEIRACQLAIIGSECMLVMP
jgi:hypothetical protein